MAKKGETVLVFRTTLEGYSPCCDETWQQAVETVSELLENADGEQRALTILIEPITMTREQFQNLPEFMGW